MTKKRSWYSRMNNTPNGSMNNRTLACVLVGTAIAPGIGTILGGVAAAGLAMAEQKREEYLEGQGVPPSSPDAATDAQQLPPPRPTVTRNDT